MEKSIFGLLAEIEPVLVEKFPWAKALLWKVWNGTAISNIDVLGDIRVDGSTLVITPPPEFLPVINFLYEEHGWKRGGWHRDGVWKAYVYRREGDLEVRLKGSLMSRPDGRDDDMNALFAPEQPELTRGKKSIEAIKEYDRKSREDEW